VGLAWRTLSGHVVWSPWLATGAVCSLLAELIRAKTRRIRRKQDFIVPPKPCPQLLTM